MEVKRTERGWTGHFICADRCRFRRNTLLEYKNIKIVVSTVGLMQSPWKKGDEFYTGEFEEIGVNRYFETMAFLADPKDTRYHDADVAEPISFDHSWSINIVDADDKANIMHDNVVLELTEKLLSGEIK